MLDNINSTAVAECFVRIFLGVIFLFQGYDKLFVLRLKNIVQTFKSEANKKHVPDFLIAGVASFTAITEFFGGILLLLGLFHEYAEWLMALNLIVVAVAFSVLEPVWDMKHVFPRVVLLAMLMYFSSSFSFGLDVIFFK